MVYYSNHYCHYRLYTHDKMFQEYDEDLDRKLPPAAKPEPPRYPPPPLEASTYLKPPPAASKNPEKNPPRKKAKSPKRRRKRQHTNRPTNPGTRIKERKAPTQEERDEEKTDRGRSALNTWYERLSDLYLYKSEHGNSEYQYWEQNVGKIMNYGCCFTNVLLANVPQKYEENPQLGIWVNKQRMELKAYELGKKSSITESKIQRLDEVGFVG
jgi:hypothetical protein